ncbi:MAG: carbonic anhydrase [Methyloprofundus sp.]|nr:MAG: carbonic anhydrase [Methyloprofundus sp.]
MIDDIKKIFEYNANWAETVNRTNPGFFSNLAKQQTPKYLWIGCSDSRVNANEIAGLSQGELFVHRNIANVVVPTDLNCLSVIQFAVEVLKVKHIIVCGHYGCGGVKASTEIQEHGLIDNWLSHIRHVRRMHEKELDGIMDFTEHQNRLCELNVIEQVANVCHSPIIQKAWATKQNLAVHGFVYDLSNGKLKNLDVYVDNLDEINRTYRLTI